MAQKFRRLCRPIAFSSLLIYTDCSLLFCGEEFITLMGFCVTIYDTVATRQSTKVFTTRRGANENGPGEILLIGFLIAGSCSLKNKQEKLPNKLPANFDYWKAFNLLKRKLRASLRKKLFRRWSRFSYFRT